MKTFTLGSWIRQLKRGFCRFLPGQDRSNQRFHTRPRKNVTRLWLEALEDRTVPSITSTVTLINNSGFTLTFAGSNFENGTHVIDNSTFPNTIANGATG